ncbi:MAG: hypothetical protein ACI9XB_000537, partial [Gammaproteobacteria bacterium]
LPLAPNQNYPYEDLAHLFFGLPCHSSHMLKS